MKHRHGFTLLEILIVVAILGALAGIILPQFGSAVEEARPAALAANVAHIRTQIAYHSGISDVTLSEEGFPDTIDPRWFMSGQMPKHAWAGVAIRVKVESKPADEVYPKKKTYKPDQKNAWYNTTNGAFCVLVPDTIEDDADIIAAFNKANFASITVVDQKVR